MIDINHDGKSSPDFNALELQTGLTFKNQQQYNRELLFKLKDLKCMEISKDIAFIGAQEEFNNDAIDYIDSQGGFVIK